jgi:hypothetical protein
MHINNFLLFLCLICLSFGAPGPFASTDTNGFESDVNQLPVQNETILKARYTILKLKSKKISKVKGGYTIKKLNNLCHL